MIAPNAATSVCSFVNSASVQWGETVKTSRIPAHSALRCANGAQSSVAFTAMTKTAACPDHLGQSVACCLRGRTALRKVNAGQISDFWAEDFQILQ